MRFLPKTKAQYLVVLLVVVVLQWVTSWLVLMYLVVMRLTLK